MEVCFPTESKYNPGGESCLIVDGAVIQLVQGPVVLNFPLCRWIVFQDLLSEISTVVDYVRNNRWAYMKEHLGGNVFVETGIDCSEVVDIRRYYVSPLDNKKHPTAHGVKLTFNQFDLLLDISNLLRDLIPALKDTLPCYMTHQNVEGAVWCHECNPDGEIDL